MPTYPLKWGSARLYQMMPLSLAKRQSKLQPGVPRGRVDLLEIGPGVEPLGLDIMGETVIGRITPEPGTEPVDLDMNPYGGAELGVSRRHAMFRPTTEHLYLVDLRSTNGTQHNGKKLTAGVVQPLDDKDRITLGKLTFTIRIIDKPDVTDSATGSSPLSGW